MCLPLSAPHLLTLCWSLSKINKHLKKLKKNPYSPGRPIHSAFQLCHNGPKESHQVGTESAYFLSWLYPILSGLPRIGFFERNHPSRFKLKHIFYQINVVTVFRRVFLKGQSRVQSVLEFLNGPEKCRFLDHFPDLSNQNLCVVPRNLHF